MKQRHDLDKVLDRLNYDFQSFELTHFIQHVAIYRQRRIFVNPLPLELELSAAWVQTQKADYIFYNERAHPVQQTHSILHEVAHMLLEHPSFALDSILPPELLNQMRNEPAHGRCRRFETVLHDSTIEREAEALVMRVQQRLVNARRLSELTGPSTSIQELRGWVDAMAFTE